MDGQKQRFWETMMQAKSDIFRGGGKIPACVCGNTTR